MELFIGIIIGLIYSMIGISVMILTTRYILTKDLLHGIYASIGTIIAQMIWATIAVFAIKLLHFHVSDMTTEMHKLYFVLPSMLFLFFIAYRIYNAPMPVTKETTRLSVFGAFATLFTLSISRPIRILGYAVLFSIFVVHLESFTLFHILMLLLGVLCGLSLWGFAFCVIATYFREKITPQAILKFSRICALLIFILAFLPLLSLLPSH